MISNAKRMLKTATTAAALALGLGAAAWHAAAAPPPTATGGQAAPATAAAKTPAATADLKLKGVAVEYLKDLDLLVFEQRGEGTAAGRSRRRSAGWTTRR